MRRNAAEVTSPSDASAQSCSGESVEWHVVVERLDHPIAVLPHRPQRVLFVAVAVGVACEIEPGPRPSLTVVRRGEESIDDAFVRIRRGVGKKGVDFC